MSFYYITGIKAFTCTTVKNNFLLYHYRHRYRYVLRISVFGYRHRTPQLWERRPKPEKAVWASAAALPVEGVSARGARGFLLAELGARSIWRWWCTSQEMRCGAFHPFNSVPVVMVSRRSYLSVCEGHTLVGLYLVYSRFVLIKI